MERLGTRGTEQEGLPRPLSPRDTFILKHYKKDMTTQQIADYLGIPRGSVVTRYAYLRGKRRGNTYIRDDGTVIKYAHSKRPNSRTYIDDSMSEAALPSVTLPKVTLDR